MKYWNTPILQSPTKGEWMKVTFLGAGSAFSRKHGNSNLLIESGGIKLLIDCSRFCPPTLEEYGLSSSDITHIFISHLHADHIGGLLGQ